MSDDPKKGWHWDLCNDCLAIYSKTTHFGGDTEIICGYCHQGKCFDCFNKSEKLKERA